MILIAYDGSDDARQATAAAGQLFSGKALVLHVLSLPGAGDIPLAPTTGAEALAVTVPEAEEEARRTAQAGADLARRAGFEAEPLVERGDGLAEVAETIARVADERQARAVVVGRRGMSKLRAVVLGSVSNAVVERARCPVVVVPEARES